MRFSFVIGLLMAWQTLDAQENSKNWSLSGYIKNLTTINVADDSALTDNLIHNRLNFSWDPSAKVHAQIELRNRLFFGDMVATIPNYGSFIDVNNDYLKLSYYFPEDKNWIFHTMLDRAYLEWHHEKWEIRGGRQRINWGVNLVWNPNDIFNSYSFFDFDYEERPGSDAIRIRRYTGFASSFELAASLNSDFDQIVIAGMYKFNFHNYDIQALIGKAREDLTAGIGWAGNLGDASFKGEVSYFLPYQDNLFDKTLLASLSIDYSFKNSLYLHGSYLFNQVGVGNTALTELDLNLPATFTVRDLSPFRHSAFLQGSYSLHPLIDTGLAIIYYPTGKAFFLNPNITFSLRENWDLDLIGQLFYDDPYGDIQAQIRLFYARLKWSF